MGNDVAAVAAVFLFPHTTIVDELEQALMKLIQGEEIDPRKIASRIGFMTRQVGQLVEKVDRTYLVVTEDKTGRVSEISPRFRHCHSAEVIRSGMVVGDDNRTWTTRKRPDYPSVLDQITEETLIIGGFHFIDCIPELVFAAHEKGKKVFVSLHTTNLHYLYCRMALRELPYWQLDEVDLSDFKGILEIMLETRSD